MRQLTPRDASFLFSDTLLTNSNVTFIQIHDQRTARAGVVRFKEILSHIQGRLPLAPILRSRLLHVPFELDDPYWIEDEHFDLEYHVRHIALPRPGDWRQFCIQASRIHARALDMNRPLWEIYVIEGLDGIDGMPRGSFALLTKIHRAAIDPEHPDQIVDLLHDATRRPRKPAPPAPWFPEPPPNTLALALRGALRIAFAPLSSANPLMRLAPVAAAFARDILRPQHATVTRFNSVISPHRVFDTARFDDAEFEHVRRLVADASLDDVVLAIVGGGLRRYLQAHGELPADGLTVLAATPGAPPGTAWQRLPLGTMLADPLARLALVHEQRGSVPPPAGVDAAPGLVGCSVVNMPVPAAPRYLCGARLIDVTALLPIADGMGLVFAVTRYDGRIAISPTSCRELLPDPQVLVQCLREAVQEYLALAPPAPSTTPPTRAARRRPAAGMPAPRPLTVRSDATAPRPGKADPRRSRAPRR
jgi:WS/DGAT/MGAT family acyltransferase